MKPLQNDQKGYCIVLRPVNEINNNKSTMYKAQYHG